MDISVEKKQAQGSPDFTLLLSRMEDEITGTDKKKMKCRFCGNRFVGQIYDRRPECFSSDTEEVIDQRDDGYW